ncbi:hypothetical protein DM02DRAFT_265332 [Periconia macrospinosa]|uniref:Uncharacterized protein n=1 Tax=Periconia macrospinosa TaxID=97972 RepID=A0A2V1E183_9PLEO|nr:hypothetical protein DM02DRAFT_265332 [Periconia macrospinosa]
MKEGGKTNDSLSMLPSKKHDRPPARLRTRPSSQLASPSTARIGIAFLASPSLPLLKFPNRPDSSCQLFKIVKLRLPLTQVHTPPTGPDLDFFSNVIVWLQRHQQACCAFVFFCFSFFAIWLRRLPS